MKVSGKELAEFSGFAEDPQDDEAFDKWAVLGLKLGPDEQPPPEDELRERSAERIRAAESRPLVILGLEPGAGSKSVRRAYHALALLHHPDKGGDEVVFKAISDAYGVLTESQDESGGWRDLENVNLPPWQAHSELGSTKGISVVLFDAFGTPPWESRRLYTGSFQEGAVKCWELSPPHVDRQPKLVGELAVGGFVNDAAALSPFGFITAQSAGMKPQPGESMRTWNLRMTPFRPVERAQANAISDSAGGSAQARIAGTSEGAAAASHQSVAAADSQLAAAPGGGEEIDETTEFTATDEFGYLDKSQMVYLHYRGVRSLSLWPRPGSVRDSMPTHVASVSKDVIAVSKISMDGRGLEPAHWKQTDPHDMTDISVIRHEAANLLWTGDNLGLIKCWDVNASGKGVVLSMGSGAGGWITALELWREPGVVCVSHTSGMVFLDGRAGKVVQDMKKKDAVGSITSLGNDHPTLFAGVGRDLMQYDTRMFGPDLDYKKMAVGMWTLSAPVTALACTESTKGHLLVAAGCLNGKVAVLDTT